MSLLFGINSGYHFTSSSGTDWTGNQAAATISGTTATTDKNGNSNSALSFNGTSDYVDTGYNPDCRTLSIWVKHATTSVTDGISSQRFDAAEEENNWSLFQLSSGAYQFNVYDSFPNLIQVTTNGTYDDTNWHHIVIVSHPVDGIKIYVDGVLDITDGSYTGVFGSGANDDNWIIGRAGDNGTWYYWDGSIDEPRTWNRALTQYEITQLYYGYDTEFNQFGVLDQGIEVLYHFTGNANDDSGNSNNGTVTGAALTTDKASVSNQAYLFAGGDDINCNVSPNYGTDNFAMSIWAQHTDGTASGNEIIFRQDTTHRVQLFLNDTSGNPRWNVVGSSTSFDRTVSGTSIGTGWHHFVLKREGDDFELWMDGVIIDSVTSAVGTVNPTSNMTLGNVPGGGTSADWRGKLDEFRLYTRTLTDTEVKQLYYGYDTTDSAFNTLDQDAIGLYSFTGDATDSSGNSNDGTVQGATLTTDKNSTSNQAYDFDGSNDYIDIPIDENDLTADACSYSLWFNADTNAATAEFLNGSDGGTNDSPALRLLTSGRIQANARGSSAQISATTATSTISTGTWYHVLTTYTTSDVEIYINGILDTTASGTTGAWGTWPELDIGRIAGSASGHFDGKIDEIKIYDRIPTEDEIIELAYGYDSPTMAEDTAAPANPTLKATFFGAGF